jgi:glycosyltransferase involved in cell wall biosynthesis
MTEPLVSICIPTFNGNRFIAKTIESALAQTYANIEIVVSDQFSTDGTLDTIRSYSDQRIRIVKPFTVVRAADNWNSALNNAKGDYVKILCQDDLIKSNCIATEVAALQSNPKASFCFSPRDVISPFGRKILNARGLKIDTDELIFPENLSVLLRSGTNIFGEPCAVLMRATSLRQVGPFRGSYLIDLSMWLELWKVGSALSIDEALSQFRVSRTSWTSQLKNEQHQQVRNFFNEICQTYSNLCDPLDLSTGLKRSKRLEQNRGRLMRIVDLIRY